MRRDRSLFQTIALQHPYKRIIRKTLGAIAVIALAASCGGQPQSGSSDTAASGGSDRPQELKILSWQAPTILNPHLSTGFKDFDGARVTYEPLATYNDQGELIPFLAAEVPTRENGGIADDGKSVTWKLKEGIQWSDGEPFSADDVVFTYEYLSNPETAATTTPDYTAVESVEAIDDTTVKVNFKDVNPAWDLPFVGLNGMILPRHIFEDYQGTRAKDAPANRKPVGTGPYRVTEFKPGDVVVYEPNPHFRDAVPFERVEIKGGGDATSAARAVLQTGDADYALNPQVETAILNRLEAAGQGKIVSAFDGLTERIHINFADPARKADAGDRPSQEFPHPFLSDPKVREALSLAIDRDTITEQLYGKTGQTTANILVAPDKYVSDTTAYRFDPDAAAALLDEAGWVDSNGDGRRDQDGTEMQLIFATSVNPLRQKTQEIIKQTLQNIGVGVELRSVDASVFFSGDPGNPDTITRFPTDLQMYTTGNSSPDPASSLKGWTCDEIASSANNWSLSNYSGYCNPEFDRLWRASTTELDPTKRGDLFKQMNDLLIEEVGVIPVVNRAKVGAVSNDLEGVALTPWDSDTWNIKDWRRAEFP